jgi:hypothetical protein
MCDTWGQHSAEWWLGERRRKSVLPFDDTWIRGHADLRKVMLRYGTDWDDYYIVWAHKKYEK